MIGGRILLRGGGGGGRGEKVMRNIGFSTFSSSRVCLDSTTKTTTRTRTRTLTTSSSSCYTDRRSSAILVGGGVGPAAGVELHSKIVGNTSATGDADHFTVFHVSASSRISDRTGYLTKKSSTTEINPGQDMADVFRNICPDDSFTKLIVGVPCNTFHGVPIWNAFTSEVSAMWPERDVRVVHMLEETAAYLSETLPDSNRNVGLMSTTGTRQTNLYRNLLEPLEIELVEVRDEETQKELHDTIYDTEFGLKAVWPATNTARENFSRYANELVSSGVSAIILGCTEIPFAFPGMQTYEGVNLVDPVDVLARSLIREAEGA